MRWSFFKRAEVSLDNRTRKAILPAYHKADLCLMTLTLPNCLLSTFSFV